MTKWIVAFTFAFILLTQISAQAAELQKARWTFKDQSVTEISKILPLLSAQLKISLSEQGFQLAESTPLAGMGFSFYQQTIDGVAVRNAGVRIWKDPTQKTLIQMLAWVLDPNSKSMKLARAQYKQTLLESSLSDISFASVQKIAKNDLDEIKNFKAVREWSNERVVLALQVFGSDRSVEYLLDPRSLVTLSKKVQFYPEGDLRATRKNAPDEYSVLGRAFRVNEDVELAWGRQASGAVPELVELKYLKKEIKGAEVDWTSSLPQTEFLVSKEDEIKASTPEGRAQGYWSNKSIQEMIDTTTAILPTYPNQGGGVAFLAGRYVQVLIDRDAFQKFNVQSFVPFYSTVTTRQFVVTDQGHAITLAAESYGKPFASATDLQSRQAPYEIQRNTNALINEGFDEMQVYWSVTQWFETLHEAGFVDPELSTRPVRAYLFDPSISMQNNAYYNNDTINFTTYTDESANEARNLNTVWHELGHGLMDRLQGSSGFSNGGLSEGIADFAAEMVARGFYKNKIPTAIAQRRIVNRIGFNLTSEGHDDGEAYGGSLKDLMDLKVAAEGWTGYLKTCDLVLDAMRLTRRSPNLSLTEWYEALVLADSFGKSGLRSSYEFASLLSQSFSGRNYIYQQPPIAKMSLFNDNVEIADVGPGSRRQPLRLNLNAGESKTYNLKLNVSSTGETFRYPFKVVVAFKETNALQGSAKFQDETDHEFVLNSAEEIIQIPVTVIAGCDAINTSGPNCSDFVNVQVFAKDQTMPFAKKRFYVVNKAL